MHLTNAEAAEHVQRVQMDRRVEREVLAAAGQVSPEVERRRWWFW